MCFQKKTILPSSIYNLGHRSQDEPEVSEVDLVASSATFQLSGELVLIFSDYGSSGPRHTSGDLILLIIIIRISIVEKTYYLQSYSIHYCLHYC